MPFLFVQTSGVQRGDCRIQRSDRAYLLLADKKLAADLRRCVVKQTARLGVAFKQRIEIGIQIHGSHLLRLACAAKAAVMLDAALTRGL